MKRADVPAGAPRDHASPPTKGQETRQRILDHAVDRASREGLEGLTIGVLAEALDMSKAGVFAHFGSKEELQLATIEAAREAFVREVGLPALAAPEGLPRLQVLCARWMDYAETLSGGCFFSAASTEFDNRPGPVRDRVAAIMREWLDALEGAIGDARARGHLKPDVDERQLAFELHALELGANWARQLFRDGDATRRAREAQRQRLDAVSTAAGKRLAARHRD